MVKDNDGNEQVINREELWIGDCTTYIQPTVDDGEIGWDWNHPRCQKFVLEVRMFVIPPPD
mgnify:CR=1 FL=1